MAGQTYPEPSPYDRLILDQRVRFDWGCCGDCCGRDGGSSGSGDENDKSGIRSIEASSGFQKGKDNAILVHPEESWRSLCNVGADNKRNLCASGKEENGDVDQVLSECRYVVDQTYHTKANQQTMMETFRNLLLYGCLWTAQCCFVHPGDISCQTDSFPCPWNSKIKDSCYKATDWRRIRGETDDSV